MADNTQQQQPPTPSSSVLFARGVLARLNVWPTLRVAVQESWGGPKSADKRTWLASEIVDAFEQQVPAPDDQYVEEMLIQVMEDEFDCVVEDGSGEGVAADIVRMWAESQVGKQETVLKFEELAEKMRGKRIAAEIVTEGNEVDEAPQLIDRGPRNQPEVDEDGFTLVKKKGRK
ncbi:hypothetical protein AX17_007531 [Amanita inopinata Kibby_2008]|nr:hypothetical protein AX17_007531 [Amanita inopinata Kibby_2008]